ncbi:UNVERIFIED_ORG: hypothetical protein EDC92_1433 [Dietzia maris]
MPDHFRQIRLETERINAEAALASAHAGLIEAGHSKDRFDAETSARRHLTEQLNSVALESALNRASLAASLITPREGDRHG